MLAVGIAGGSAANNYAYNGSELLKPSRSLNEDLKEPISLRLDATATNTELEYRAQDQIITLTSNAQQEVYAAQNSLYKNIDLLEIDLSETDEEELLAILQKDDKEKDKTLSEEERVSPSNDESQESVLPYANADTSEVEDALSFGLTSESSSLRSNVWNSDSSSSSSSSEEE